MHKHLNSLIILLFVLYHSGFAEGNNKRNEITNVPISSPTEYIQQPFDVIHYDADFEFQDISTKKIKAICRIKIFWKDTPDTNLFYFNLRGLQVDSVFYNNTHIDAIAIGNESSPTFHYNVPPPPGSKQDTAIITIKYSGTMTNVDNFGGVFYDNGILYAVGVGFSNNYVSTTQHWLACYDHPSDKATYSLNFKVKKGLKVAGNGKLNSDTSNTEYNIFNWSSIYPASTYLLTFAISNFAEVKIDGFYWPIVIYSRPSDTLATKSVYRLVPWMTTCFQNKFGRYPFEKIGYVNTPITRGAMEHQTMVTMMESQIRELYQANDSLNMFAAHELSHQWLGDMVSVFDFRDAWLNEGFAKFAENTWVEEVRGYKSYLGLLTSQNNYYLNQIIKNEGVLPLYNYSRKSPSSNYPSTIYYKGASVVSLLRFLIGDEKFYPAMKDYLEKHAYSNVTTNDLKLFLESNLGIDLTNFFEQWVYKPGYPILNITSQKVKTDDSIFTAKINIKQIQQDIWGTYKTLPIEFGFLNPDGNWTYRIVTLDNKEDNFILDSLKDYSYVAVNSGPSIRVLIKINSLVTNVNEIDNHIDFEINPNPSDTQITLKLINIQHDVQFSIFDLSGFVHISDKISSGAEFYPIDTSALPSGIYYAKIESKGFSKIVSFIVNH